MSGTTFYGLARRAVNGNTTKAEIDNFIDYQAHMRALEVVEEAHDQFPVIKRMALRYCEKKFARMCIKARNHGKLDRSE